MSSRSPRSASASRLQLTLATGLGLGLAPVAPGTFGALAGVALHAIAFRLGGWPLVLGVLLGVIAVGIPVSTAAERHYTGHDPGRVVIDEVGGQLLTLLPFPATTPTLIAGFLLFRLFDIAKPFPIRRVETIGGGSGIMADDLVAGIYAALGLAALRLLFPDLMGVG